MTRSQAAIFDLDRTIISVSSGPDVQHHLAEHGLGRAGTALSDFLFQSFNHLGESGLIMQLARFAARTAKGKSVEQMLEAATAAAADLEELVLPYARQLFDEHHNAGRLLVLATTSPASLVEPFAQKVGFDALLATRWEVEDGVFTGALDGRFVWARGKALEVRDWARANDVSLRGSWAYSDSYYDAPLLSSVGNPVAVNPDPRLAVLAVLKKWPIRHLDAPPGVVKILGRELQELLRPLARDSLIPNARIEIVGIENIPARGGAIVCANHRSYFDSAVVSLLLAKAGRNGRFLGKKEVFDAPILGQLAAAAGGIRVERASGSDEPLERAADALRAGEVVAMMPQGTIPRGPAFFDPELRGRWGAARLAEMSRVPVIPVGIWGTEKVWPRSSRLPRLNMTDPPLVTVRVGEPVALEYDDVDLDTKRIMAAIVDQLPPEAREQRQPTDEELALTFPPGYEGDPHAEVDRRPGMDTLA